LLLLSSATQRIQQIHRFLIAAMGTFHYGLLRFLKGQLGYGGYDPLYELTQVTQGASTTESYSYDAVGNKLSSSGVASYSYNASNELTSNALGSYTYDANGNTLSDAQRRSFSWDFENRLIQAVVPGTNGGTTTFSDFEMRLCGSWRATFVRSAFIELIGGHPMAYAERTRCGG